MTDMSDQLDESPRKGLVFERNFWRHPVTKAAMVVMPDGKSRQLRSPSGEFKDHLDNTKALEKWTQRKIVEGLFAMVSRGDIDADTVHDLPDDDKRRRQLLDGYVVDALDAAKAHEAAAHGTHTHLTTELQDEGAHWLTVAERGEDIGLPTEAQQALVEVWLELCRLGGLEILTVEQTVANDHTAGTLDRTAVLHRSLEFTRTDGSRVVIPAGTVVVLDVKTGQLRTDRQGRPLYWTAYAHQIGHYANARPIWIDPNDPKGNVWSDWDRPPSTQHALIAHLDVAGALEGRATGRLVYCDLTHWEPMTATVDEVRYWRKLQPFSPCGGDPDVVIGVDAEPSHGDLLSWLQGRINLLGLTVDGARLLKQHWPDGVATPKNGTAPEDVDTVAGLLDRIEAQIGAPFGESDPRVQTPVTDRWQANQATKES